VKENPPHWVPALRRVQEVFAMTALYPQQATDSKQRISEIASALAVLHDPGELIEFRAILRHEHRQGDRDAHHLSSRLFRDPQEVAKLALLAEPTCLGCYATLQVIQPDLLPANQKERKRSIRDENVIRYRWIPIDVDPVKVGEDGAPNANLSSSEADRTNAWNVMQQVREFCRGLGFVGAVQGDSGNGFHLLIPIDVENDGKDGLGESMVQAFLRGLDARFSDGSAKVDVKVCNPSRIWKLYGTLSAKGSDSPDRPHRYAALIDGKAPSQEDREHNTQALRTILAEWAAKQRAASPFALKQSSSPKSPFERAQKYLETVEASISGTGTGQGHRSAFWAARVAVWGFGLSSGEAMAAMAAWNARCVPPWSHQELEHKIEQALSVPFDKPYLWLLHAESNSHTSPRHEANGVAPAGQQELASPPCRLLVQNLADVRLEPVRWLVPDLIPSGKLTLLAGDGGLGKSTVTLDLAAALTMGRPAWGLDYDPGDPSDVLLLSCEDDASDTVLPRFLAAGGARERMHLLRGRLDEKGEVLPFNLLYVHELLAHLEKHPGIRLVVIDPVSAYLGGKVDEHKDSDLRIILRPLTDAAARTGVAVILIKHLNKAQGARAIHRIAGSAAYVNAVRQVLTVAADPEDDDRRLLMPVKANLTRDRRALAYRMAQLNENEARAALVGVADDHLSQDDRDAVARQLFRISWEGRHDVDADAVMSPARKTDRGPNKVDACAAWILEGLQAMAWPDDEVEKAAVAAGFTVDNFRKAKTKLKKDRGLASRPNGQRGEWWIGIGRPEEWVRRLPGQVWGADLPQSSAVSAVSPDSSVSVLSSHL
jgi:hypothetical protein